VIVVSAGSRGVLVIGGAGQPAGGAVQRLLDAGRPVRVVVDGQGRGAAQGVWPPGAELVHGSLDDRAGLDQALIGIEALVVVLDQTDASPAGRLRRGKAIGDAAARAGVRQIVYSAGTGSDHHLVACDQSEQIVDHLRTLDLSLTVLRPVTLMEEIPWYWLSLMGREATLATPYEPDLRLALICGDDVGGLAARAIQSPERFAGKAIEIAGDKASMAEVGEILALELRRPVRVTEVQVEGVFMRPEPYEPAVDIAALRRLYPELRTLRSWLTLNGGLELCRRALARPAA
jgi:uncharacterized protein YbjT (DUF2867 family)